MISLNSLISTISFRFSGKIITKLKAINLLLYQEVYSRGIDILALAFPTVLSPFLMAIASIVYGPGEVAKNMLLQQELTDTHRATIASINSLLQSCFYAFVAFLLGSAAGKIGLAKTLFVAQISLFPVFLLYLKVFYTTKRRGDFSPSPQDSGTK